jgi:hypothetical protein
MLQKGILFLAFRIVAVYELTNHMSVKHLESRALPILAKQKNNPLKNDLLDKISEFWSY